MINHPLKVRMVEKVDEGDFRAADLPDYLTLFCQICNASEDVQEEVEGWDRTIQFRLQDAPGYWLKVAQGQFAYGTGPIEGPDTVLIAEDELAASLLTGEKDAAAAYQSGTLKVQGALPDALKLRSVIEIVREELEG
jgi:putative sterol carrier protein